MNSKVISKIKNIALIAHDNKKKELLYWVTANKEELSLHSLCGTGTTAHILSKETGLIIKALESGPLGGDQQVGAEIVAGTIDFMVFFWDPLSSQPHDPDVKALLRIGVLYNIPIAMNYTTADFLLSSSYMYMQYNKFSIID